MVKIKKDIWREYLKPVKNVSENNLVERVSWSLQVEKYANNQGDIILHNVKNFLDDYGLFFEEGLIDFIAKEAAIESNENSKMYVNLGDNKTYTFKVDTIGFDVDEIKKFL